MGINIGPNKDTKNKEEDYYTCLSRLFLNAGYITINISSPNTEGLRNFHDQGELERLSGLNRIKKDKNISKPIAIKLSPDISSNDINKITEVIFKYKLDGLIISNTTDGNRNELSDVNKKEIGGLSGMPLRDLSTDLIKKFYTETKGKIQIIGVGGVDSGQTAFDKIIAGADAVQLYTGMVYKGPGVVKEMKKELISILKKEKFKKYKRSSWN